MRGEGYMRRGGGVGMRAGRYESGGGMREKGV